MKKNDFSVLISSCEKYSDLWDSHIFFYNKYWPKRDFESYLVTDSKPSKTIKDVQLIWNKKYNEFSDRILHSLTHIDSNFILLTFDDYFLKEKVKETKIQDLINFMIQFNVDYCRLYDIPMIKKPIIIQDQIHIINLKEEKSDYLVNFYPSLWKKETLHKLVQSFKNYSPWKLEAELTRYAINGNLFCLKSTGNEFRIEDIVRKGFLLNSSKKFLKKHKITINRRSLPILKEIYLKFIQNLKIFLPVPIQKFLKLILKFIGFNFYSK